MKSKAYPKKQKKQRIFRTILLLLCVTALVVAVALFYRQATVMDDSTAEDATLEVLLKEVKPNSAVATENYLADAQAINPQTVAWLTIPDTEIDFPIVQGEDNSYYLDHAFTGESYGRGCPFLDYRNANDFSDFNSIIYGHNIKNTYVFAPLLYFREQDYFEAHPTGTLVTETEVYTIQFLACAVVENDSFIYSVVHPAKSDRTLYLEMLQETAVTQIDFDAAEYCDSHLLVLSTCSDDYDTARTVLVGVLT